MRITNILPVDRIFVDEGPGTIQSKADALRMLSGYLRPLSAAIARLWSLSSRSANGSRAPASVTEWLFRIRLWKPRRRARRLWSSAGKASPSTPSMARRFTSSSASWAREMRRVSTCVCSRESAGSFGMRRRGAHCPRRPPRPPRSRSSSFANSSSGSRA